MLKRRIVAALAIGIVAVGMFPQLEPNNRRNNRFLANGAARSQLRDAIARMTDLQSNEIEIDTTNTIIRGRYVNTPYNGKSVRV